MDRSKIVRVQEVQHRTGMSKTTIDRLERAGRFPARVRITDRAIGWYEEEVLNWLSSRQLVNNDISQRGEK